MGVVYFYWAYKGEYTENNAKYTLLSKTRDSYYNVAIKMFEKAVEIDQDFHGAWFYMGGVCKYIGRRAMAKICFARAKKEDAYENVDYNSLNTVLRLWDSELL